MVVCLLLALLLVYLWTGLSLLARLFRWGDSSFSLPPSWGPPGLALLAGLAWLRHDEASDWGAGMSFWLMAVLSGLAALQWWLLRLWPVRGAQPEGTGLSGDHD